MNYGFGVWYSISSNKLFVRAATKKQRKNFGWTWIGNFLDDPPWHFNCRCDLSRLESLSGVGNGLKIFSELNPHLYKAKK